MLSQLFAKQASFTFRNKKKRKSEVNSSVRANHAVISISGTFLIQLTVPKSQHLGHVGLEVYIYQAFCRCPAHHCIVFVDEEVADLLRDFCGEQISVAAPTSAVSVLGFEPNPFSRDVAAGHSSSDVAVAPEPPSSAPAGIVSRTVQQAFAEGIPTSTERPAASQDLQRDPLLLPSDILAMAARSLDVVRTVMGTLSLSKDTMATPTSMWVPCSLPKVFTCIAAVRRAQRTHEWFGVLIDDSGALVVRQESRIRNDTTVRASL